MDRCGRRGWCRSSGHCACRCRRRSFRHDRCALWLLLFRYSFTSLVVVLVHCLVGWLPWERSDRENLSILRQALPSTTRRIPSGTLRLQQVSGPKAFSLWTLSRRCRPAPDPKGAALWTSGKGLAPALCVGAAARHPGNGKGSHAFLVSMTPFASFMQSPIWPHFAHFR